MSKSILSSEPVAINGVQLNSVYSGIRKSEKDDLVLIALNEGSRTAVVYTRNAFCAAPVVVAKQHQAKTDTRYLLINAGNANAGTGQKGLDAALASCQAIVETSNAIHAQRLESASVLPFSTGVIGEYLPFEKITASVPDLFAGLSKDNWSKAAQAIMTTDTVAKTASIAVTLSNGKQVTISGMCKGAGMICPDMATMLSYVATDACIEQDALQQLLNDSVSVSFNSISVDGDTSTNDACVLMATQRASNMVITHGSEDYAMFLDALNQVMMHLAKAIVRDGEGATKLLTIRIKGAKNTAECKQLGYAICHSPLVKTALFASDPNWGRILAVIGRAGLDDLVLSDVSFSLNGVRIVNSGERDAQYHEELGVNAMVSDEIELNIELNRGDSEHTLWTCDLGYEYVRINAEYRT